MNSRGTTLVSGGHSLSGTHFDTLYRGEATAVHTLVPLRNLRLAPLLGGEFTAVR